MKMKKVEAPFVRSPYNYDMNEASDRHGLKCEDKSLTQQHMLEETDINWLVERYTVPENIPQLTMPPLQGDFTEAPTYQEALNLMVAANRSFMELPAKIRSRFGNDPAEFVTFCSDEKNRDEIRQMGLWSPEAVKAWEEKAAAEKALQAANAAAAEELKTLKGKKGDTQKSVT